MIRTLNEKLKTLRTKISDLWKYLFCKHDWSLENSSRYDITDKDKKIGEVTLNYLHCKKCGDYKILISDRSWTLKKSNDGKKKKNK